MKFPEYVRVLFYPWAARCFSTGQHGRQAPRTRRKTPAGQEAKAIATLLEGLGVTAVRADWRMEPEPADGGSDLSGRQVTVEVIR
jgi:hypothetical protein